MLLIGKLFGKESLKVELESKQFFVRRNQFHKSRHFYFVNFDRPLSPSLSLSNFPEFFFSFSLSPSLNLSSPLFLCLIFPFLSHYFFLSPSFFTSLLLFLHLIFPFLSLSLSLFYLISLSIFLSLSSFLSPSLSLYLFFI